MLMSQLKVICAAIALATSLAWAEEAENLQCPQAGSTVIFYVDDDAVGAASTWWYHRNRIDRPVSEIAIAKQLIRDMRGECGDFNTLDYHIKVYLREGTYAPDTDAGSTPLPKELTFDTLDGGSSGFPIIYSAYSADQGVTYEDVLISGGVEVDGWSQSQPGAWWAANLPWTPVDWRDELVPRDLYVNNERAVRAREPDNAWATVESHEFTTRITGTGSHVAWHGMFYDPTGTDPKSIAPDPLPDMDLGAKISHNEYFLDTDYNFPQESAERGYRADRGTECVLRWRGGWASFRQYVIRPHHAGDPGRIRLWDAIGMPADESEFDIINDDPMACTRRTEVYLENAKEFMDEDFEWWYNPPGTDGTGENRIWIILPDALDPTGTNPTKDPADIVAAHANQLFQFEDVSHIRLENLNFAHTRQPLPIPPGYDDLVNSAQVAVWQVGQFDRKSKTKVGDEGLITQVEYPQIGWTERGRALSLYDNPSGRFAHDAAIRITNGAGISISRCRIAHTGGAGVIIESGSDHAVSECEIFDTGGSAVAVVREDQLSHFGVGPDNTEVAQQFTVSQNYIYNVGMTYLSSPAIFIGWTATDVRTGSVTNDGGQVTNNYIGSVPGEGIRAGYQAKDNILLARSQSRNLRINNNIVRDPVLLIDDMAGIGVVYDGDGNCEVNGNVVYSTVHVPEHAKHALYTDGHGIAECGTSGWSLIDNVVWNFERPFHMNPKFTCPEDNNWLRNYVDQMQPLIVCATCDEQDQQECPDPDLEPGETPVGDDCEEELERVLETFFCANGYPDMGRYHLPFDSDATSTGMDARYKFDPDLADNCFRVFDAQDRINQAGPNIDGDLGTETAKLRQFLYTSYISLIHPTLPAATDRTPPLLKCP